MSGAPGFPLRERTILLTLAGSRAYGLHKQTSDLDLKGVAVPPAPWFHAVFPSFEQADAAADLVDFAADLTEDERGIVARTKLEGSVFELRKLMRLAADANPNILDVLFCRDEEVRRITPLGRKLREGRHLFVTARCRYTFAGYASAQLKRIRLHKRWHDHGPAAPPTRAEYGLPEVGLLPKDQLAAAEAAVRKKLDSWNVDWGGLPEPERIALEGRLATWLAELGLGADEARWVSAARLVGLGDNLIHVMQQERAHGAAVDEWRRYQVWKRERNVDRAALEVQFGYDTKHAMHLVRLLRMAREILETGQVHVWRGDRDADELLAIRGGAWSYERLVAWAEAEEAALDRVVDVALPAGPDRAAIDALCREIVEEALRSASLAG